MEKIILTMPYRVQIKLKGYKFCNIIPTLGRTVDLF